LLTQAAATYAGEALLSQVLAALGSSTAGRGAADMDECAAAEAIRFMGEDRLNAKPPVGE
jgi:hypothetical protein